MTGETILVVDDTRDNLDFVVEYVLEPKGYVPLTANNGKEGLDLILKHNPDLILLDYNMPILDGPGMLREMQKFNLNIPVILMTFHGSEDIAVEVFRLGVRDYIIKPFYPEEMLNAIERHLSEIRLQREKEALTDRILQANRDLKMRLQELNMLYSIGKQVTALVNMQKLLVRVVDAAVQITRSEQGYIHIIQDQHLVCRAFKPSSHESAKAQSAICRDPLAITILKTSKPAVLSANQTLKFRPKSPTCVVYTPLIVANRIIGLLGVERPEANPGDQYTSHESALLSALSDYVAIAITNSRNYEARQKLKADFQSSSPASVISPTRESGSRQEVTTLVLNLHSAVSWSEKASPQEVINTLDEYITLAIMTIQKWGGTLSKVLGDGLIAVFNAPQSQPDHIHRAVEAAITLMQSAEVQASSKGRKISYGVGINVGEGVVGSIGTEDNTTYAVIGASVNLAKRLGEYAAPGQILAEEAVIQRMGNTIKSRALGELKVKGRKQPAQVFEIISLRPEDD